MEKRVVVIASGDTERRALPHLLGSLSSQGIIVTEVRVPPGHLPLNVRQAEKLIKAAWYGASLEGPHKFVVLVDVDGADPDLGLASLRGQLPGRLGDTIRATVLYAYAQWHLEAWFFADAANLRRYFDDGALGSVDTTKPDDIQNPKLHLKNLLGNRGYTARVSEEIARSLDPQVIAQRSPSFRGFLAAVMNGDPAVPAASA